MGWEMGEVQSVTAMADKITLKTKYIGTFLQCTACILLVGLVFSLLAMGIYSSHKRLVLMEICKQWPNKTVCDKST